MIILDFGSGNTVGTDLDYGRRMIDELAKVDSHKHLVIIKWQLFEKCGENVPLNRGLFGQLYEYAWECHGYLTTASVFDENSLRFLLYPTFDVPFVKIANNKRYYPLIDMIPEGVRVIKSVGDAESFGTDCMCCVSEYPADSKQYEKAFKKGQLKQGISDHTVGLDLYKKHQPQIWEKHFVLERGVPTNPDSGPFAILPDELRELL